MRILSFLTLLAVVFGFMAVARAQSEDHSFVEHSMEAVAEAAAQAELNSFNAMPLSEFQAYVENKMHDSIDNFYNNGNGAEQMMSLLQQDEETGEFHVMHDLASAAELESQLDQEVTALMEWPFSGIKTRIKERIKGYAGQKIDSAVDWLKSKDNGDGVYNQAATILKSAQGVADNVIDHGIKDGLTKSAQEFAAQGVPAGEVLSTAMQGPLGQLVLQKGKEALNSPQGRALLGAAHKALSSKFLQSPLGQKVVNLAKAHGPAILQKATQLAVDKANERVKDATGVDIGLNKGWKDLGIQGTVKEAWEAAKVEQKEKDAKRAAETAQADAKASRSKPKDANHAQKDTYDKQGKRALALVFALTGITVLTTARPEAVYSHRTNVAVEGATVSDPDPADCPFCGGDPAIHIRRMIELQQQSMRLLAETWL